MLLHNQVYFTTESIFEEVKFFCYNYDKNNKILCTLHYCNENNSLIFILFYWYSFDSIKLYIQKWIRLPRIGIYNFIIFIKDKYITLAVCRTEIHTGVIFRRFVFPYIAFSTH
jgi:hypothetical protein